MPVSPESLLQSVNFESKTGCTSQRCSCKRSGVVCTGACQSTSCGKFPDRPLAEGEGAYIYTAIVDDTDSSDDEMNEWEGLHYQ